jgi:hypothetical protein
MLLMQAHVASKVLWFTAVKACINTVMVMSGWKKSGVFKATPKAGENAADAQGASERLPDLTSSDGGRGSDSGKEKFQLHTVHDALSKVCMHSPSSRIFFCTCGRMHVCICMQQISALHTRCMC